MRFVIILLHSIYIACVLGLALYGFQAFWLTRQYLRSPRTRRRPAKPHRWPSLAVQLPIYNERHVAERIIRACCNLDYPRDRLLIQVLDDSDDATSALINNAVLQAQEQGNRIEIIRRPTRQGYKAERYCIHQDRRRVHCRLQRISNRRRTFCGVLCFNFKFWQR